MAAIKHLFHISAPRQKVYEAISTINGMAGLWTTQTTGDDNLGGVIAFRFGTVGPDFKVTNLKNGDTITVQGVQFNTHANGIHQIGNLTSTVAPAGTAEIYGLGNGSFSSERCNG